MIEMIPTMRLKSIGGKFATIKQQQEGIFIAHSLEKCKRFEE
jgi:hypothetical protein